MLAPICADKPKEKTRVVVAMSGGVDSSVAAALMAQEGYETIGITLQLYDHGAALAKKGACCAGQDIHDARRVAQKVGIPHYVLDYESRFKEQVIEDFADSYMRGETPIPCVRCNQTVKFSDLFATAKDLGADALVTGHYVRRLMSHRDKNQAELHAAIDDTRDQSYFLFATTQEQLNYLRFPLGDIPKEKTREIAKEFDLSVSDKPDSQDICFVPNGSYANIVAKLRPGALDAGDIVDLEGNILGQHKGIINFTIGQRKGIGIAAAEPLYVVEIKAESKQVVVGPKEKLARKKIMLKDINWLVDPHNIDKNKGLKISVKVRSTRGPQKATLFTQNLSKPYVLLDMPEYGISPGQACVFYDETRVLGGGWIDSTEIE